LDQNIAILRTDRNRCLQKRNQWVYEILVVGVNRQRDQTNFERLDFGAVESNIERFETEVDGL
jgi:hypothetical protein